MRLLLFSTSTLHGDGYLEYGLPFVAEFLDGVDRILFVPYARPSGITHDRYTELFAEALAKINRDVVGIHELDSPVEAVQDAPAIFVGGGNTFVLLRELYLRELVDPVRRRVAESMPYMGSSAGSNVAGPSIGTTNDMPIVHPPSLEAFSLLPFNINPHYIDPDPASRHMGETRETRIREFHAFNEQPVLAMREGALLRREGERLELLGVADSRLFRRGMEPEELAPGSSLDYLL